MGRALGVVVGWWVWCAVLLRPELSVAQARGPLELAVGARSVLGGARAERAAWLTLRVPLDAAIRPVARVAASRESFAGSEALVTAPIPGSELSLSQLRELSRLTRAATAMAFAVANIPAERRRLDGISARARLSAALPELKLRVQRTSDQALRWMPTNEDPSRVTQADGAGTTLEIVATFHFDRLLFAGEELSVERQRLQAGKQHRALEQRVTGLVLGLFRARELACADGVNEDQRIEQLLRLAEHATELDALTAGWFVDQAPSSSTVLWGFPQAILGECQAPHTAPEPSSTKPVARAENSG